jgi:membrane-bound serine protease (ClpP class)
MRWLPVFFVGAFVVSAAGMAAAQESTSRPVAIVAELDGVIHPVAAEYITGVIDLADTSGAAVVVIVLQTPGGLLDSTRDIVSRMIGSRAPVVVFVGPSGARAASAGFILTIAADVAAMAPGTHVGAAHPVSGSGQSMDETTAKKAAEDAAAYARSLAQSRGRNVSLAADAVLESRAFTDREAFEATPRLIDLIAPDLNAVLEQIDGRTIARFDGRPVTLRTANAQIRRIEMTRRQRFLGFIAHPQVAYLLMTLGMLGLTVELWNPGAILPGVAGGLCLLLAFFAFQLLSVNMTGLLLIAFGIALLILELKVPSFGVLGIGGTISLVVGSVMLTGSVPGVAVGLGTILPAALAIAAIFLFLGRLALNAQRSPPASGVHGLIGAEGRTRATIEPAASGYIDVHGELWRASTRVPLAAGELVRVTGVNGLTLIVEPSGTAGREGETS